MALPASDGRWGEGRKKRGNKAEMNAPEVSHAWPCVAGEDHMNMMMYIMIMDARGENRGLMYSLVGRAVLESNS